MSPNDTTLTGSGEGVEPVTGNRLVPGLSIAWTADPDRIGERIRPGTTPLPLDRQSPVFPGGPVGDPEISRRHAEVRRGPGGRLRIRDLGSKNGTFVNGDRVSGEGVDLAPDAIVRLGDTLLVAGDLAAVEPGDHAVAGFVGRSDQARRVRSAIARYAANEAPVLVTGESGTGKELVAEALALLGRPGRPLVRFNSGAAAPALIDSTLFGHVRGAFTDARDDNPGLFRAAHTGTLFLDEVGDLAPETQVRLLRAIESGTVTPVGAMREVRVDVRLVAATNADLAGAMAAGTFRRDLYARLAFLTIDLPPLRERIADVPLLALDFANGRTFTVETVFEMLRHPWPFNVRELRAVVEQMKADGPRRGPLSLTDETRDRMRRHRAMVEPAAASVDRATLEAVLRRNRGNMKASAEELGKDRAQLYRIAERLGVEPDRFRV